VGNIAVGHLSVADDTFERYVGERQSSKDRTASEVTTVPTLTSGRPVLVSFESVVVLVVLGPRRIRSATVSLNVRLVSRAIA
jgi:hypothetical protein